METDNSAKLTTTKVLVFLKSKGFAVAIAVILAAAVLLGVFRIGVAVGYRKARFSYAWGENYHRNFGGPIGGFIREFNAEIDEGDFMGGHGTFGSIIGIDGLQIIVKGKDGFEKIIITNAGTDIRRFNNSIKVSELTMDEPIVVIGEPNNYGQIEAKLIRVMPTPTAVMPLPGNMQYRIFRR